jgi:hypothetical protein
MKSLLALFVTLTFVVGSSFGQDKVAQIQKASKTLFEAKVNAYGLSEQGSHFTPISNLTNEGRDGYTLPKWFKQVVINRKNKDEISNTKETLLPPGAQYLGKSVNLLKGEADPGSRALLQSLASAEIDALDSGAGALRSVTKVTEDISEATSEYSAEMGIEGSYGAFSAKAEMKLSKKTRERSKTKIVLITKNIVSGKLSIKSREWKLEKEFKAKLNDANFAPKNLFNIYGTHMTIGVKVGGRFTGVFTSKEHTKESESSLEASAEASYGGVTAKGKYAQNQSNSNTKKQIDQSYIVKGGQSKYKIALETNPTFENYIAWAESVDNDPGFYSFTELKPIWEFATNPARKAELKKAFEWLFTQKSLKNIERFILVDKSYGKSSSLTVPNGYKILCGGAYVNFSGVGNMLTASYPSNTRTWYASQKDHHEESSGYLTLYAMAVYDPFNLLDVNITEKTSAAKTSAPFITVKPPYGYALVGGGSRVNYSGYGNLLIASVPQGDGSWYSMSKDHLQSDHADITGYCIGLKVSQNAPFSIQTKLFEGHSEVGGHNKKDVSPGYGYSLVGGGAVNMHSLKKYDYVSNFLTASYPENGKWIAKSKDHIDAYHSMLKVAAIGIMVMDKQP